MTSIKHPAPYTTLSVLLSCFVTIVISFFYSLFIPAPDILKNLVLLCFGTYLFQFVVCAVIAFKTKQSSWGKFSIFMTIAAIAVSAILSIPMAISNSLVVGLLTGLLTLSIIVNLICMIPTVNNQLYVFDKIYQSMLRLLAKKKALQKANKRMRDDQQEQEADLEYNLGERNLELEIALRELSEKNRELEKLSAIDSLTGLMNRRFFDKRMLAETRRSKREMTPLSVAILDIDHFKRINDTYGHLCGDHCLKEFAKLLQHEIKRPSDTISRYGGEEFVLILPNTDFNGVFNLIERIRKKVEGTTVYFESHQFNMTVSIGACSRVVKDDSENISILGFIDTLLYEAKQTGRNKVIVKDFPDPQADILK